MLEFLLWLGLIIVALISLAAVGLAICEAYDEQERLRAERLRIRQAELSASWRIHQATSRAVARMVDEVRRQQQRPQ